MIIISRTGGIIMSYIRAFLFSWGGGIHKLWKFKQP